MKLLTVGNPKIEKGRKYGFLTAILHLAPHTMSGWNVCPKASKGCSAACLNTSGRGGMFAGCQTKNLSGSEMVQAILDGKLVNKIQSARVRRTRMFFEEREKFFAQLVKEMKSVIKMSKKHNLVPVFRLNGTSDLRWENYNLTVNGIEYRNIMEVFPMIQFYDYTAIVNRRNLPKNYHLTFSRKESNDSDVDEVLNTKMNIAVVFTKLPVMYQGRLVIDGDTSDLRFLDTRNTIVGLVAKGKAKKDTSGFVKEVA